MAKRIYIGECSHNKDYVYVEVRPEGLFLIRRKQKEPVPYYEKMIVDEPIDKLNEQAFALKMHGYS